MRVSPYPSDSSLSSRVFISYRVMIVWPASSRMIACQHGQDR